MDSLRHGWLVALVASFISTTTFAQPKDRIAESVALANHALARGQAGDAVAILERQLQFANGDKAFNDALRSAYEAEIKSLTDAAAIERVKTKLSLLPAPAEVVVQPVPVPAPTSPLAPQETKPPEAKPQGVDLLREATQLFNQATSNEPTKFLSARDLFGLAFRNKVQMNNDQLSAWAYCRVKVAADRLNKSEDASTASAVVSEVEEALATVPQHEGLQKTGQEVLTLARKRAGNSTGWQTVESDSFRVKFQTNRTMAEAIAKAAEAKRGTIFARWSGPPGGAWTPKCEIVLHSDGNAFATATKLPATGTGRAEVQLDEGRAVTRRIDLRLDDTTLSNDALPRELSHVILADLFPTKSPPKWAELGMSVLAASETEIQRYHRTMGKVSRDGELLTLTKLLESVEIPGQNVTAFHVESVTLVDFLVRWQGEKAFTTFLRDAQRYGAESALKRQYGLADIKQLETAWQKFAIAGRGE